MPADVAARWSDHVAALAAGIKSSPEPAGAVADIGIEGEEVQVTAARGLDPGCRGQRLAVSCLQLAQRPVAFFAVDVDHDERARDDANVGVRPAGPPLPRALGPA